MRRDVFTHGLWQFRAGTGNFAWAGIDMALWDICGRACGQPLWRLLGGLQQSESNVLLLPRTRLAGEPRAPRSTRASQPASRSSTSRSASTTRRTSRWSSTVRERARPGPAAPARRERKLDDPAGARNLRALSRVRHRLRRATRPRPSGRAARGGARAASTTTVCANEGLWSEADAYARIRARDADVYCFSPYWVGSIGSFHRLSWLAHLRRAPGLQAHPRRARARRGGRPSRRADPAERRRGASADCVSDGARRPHRADPDRDAARAGGRSTGPGLGVEVDEDAVAEAAARYRAEGQYRPWQDYQLAKEER